MIRAEAFRPWPNGTPATIEVGHGAQRQTMAVTIGHRDQASALLHEPGGPETRLSLGARTPMAFPVPAGVSDAKTGPLLQFVGLAVGDPVARLGETVGRAAARNRSHD